MYGYLKFSPVTVGKENYKLLKKYYCATCLALKRNYGALAPLVLSYDLVIVPVLFKIQDESITHCNQCFYKKRKSCYPKQDDVWKKIAAINLAIAEQKINDSLNDEKKALSKFKYRVARVILKSSLKKAKKDFPNIFALADEGMKKTIDIENTTADVIQQGNAFADMLLPMLNCIESLTQEETDFIRGISIWLCLVDAIDDYNDDVKKNKYNPLLIKQKDKSIPNDPIFFTDYFVILSLYKEATASINKLKSDKLISQYANKIIPLQTQKVINKSMKVKRK